ncbi:MAG: tetratricopeptide (TPR) repeat protein [Planctomycetota bacterium]|jgi:tetratricopeptide (TPR) repeat protein
MYSSAPKGKTTRGVWLIITLGLLLLPAILRGGLALDDEQLLFENPVTSGALPWTAAFTRDYFHHISDSGQWRPVASLSLRLDRMIFDRWIVGFHLSNWAMHMALVALLWALLRQLRITGPGACFGIVVFALHPALADSIVWISGRTSMLSALFPVAGMLISCRWSSAGRSPMCCALPAAVGLMAGLLAKEDALVFAVAIPLVASSCRRTNLKAASLATTVTVLLWCACRSLALGAALPSAASPIMGAASLGERLAVGGAAILEALHLFILPASYPPQYQVSFLLERHSSMPLAIVATCGWTLLWLPIILFVWKRKTASTALASTALAALAFLPVTQIVPLGEVFAPRFLYLPLLFLVPFIGAVAARLVPDKFGFAAVCGLALILAGASYQRAKVYSSRSAWRSEVLRHMPNDVPSWNDLGLLREEQGDPAGARAAWRYAIELDPQYSRSWSNLGRLQLEQKEWLAAEISLREALRHGPRNAIPRVNLASLLAKQDRHREAVAFYQEATQLSPGLAPAWRGLAMSLDKLQRHSEARTALKRALVLDPANEKTQTLMRLFQSL